ncbi:MAG: MASE1 domain-containing protein [Dyella sp.]
MSVLTLNRWSGPALALAYFCIWLALWPTTQPYWMLPFGLRFGVLLLMPPRRWGWVLAAELLASGLAYTAGGHNRYWLSFVIDELPEPIVVAVCLLLLRRAHLQPRLREPEDVSRLLLSAALTVIAATTAEATIWALIHQSPSQELMIQALGQSLLGNYVGVLLIVPILVMWFRAPPTRHDLDGLIIDGLRVLLPALTILLVLSEHSAPQPQFARVLSLAPVLFFAFRHGWRGASLAMLISSLGLTLVDRLVSHDAPPAAANLFLAVAGTGALMLGAATDALRRSNDRVTEQNAYLAAANRRLDHLAQQLREAARGNLQTEENQRRHMAAELHDELGQNLTAIQTHVKLAQARLHLAGMDDVASAINSILSHMRRALHRLLDNLRPAVLDEFGLLRALDEGPVRDLLNAAGISYRTQLHGDPRLLDDDTRTAIYRIVQESATNTVKHAQASEFRLRLRIGEREGDALAFLDIRDNGNGITSANSTEGGRGLRGMRDRVTSLGGQFKLRSNETGVHLRILLRGQP